MQTEIHTKLTEFPPRFHAHAADRIHTALERWSRRLKKVRVYLRDENGRRGGLGTRCRVLVETQQGNSIVATGHGGDAESALYGALQCARDRVRRSTKRRVTRLRPRTTLRDAWEAA